MGHAAYICGVYMGRWESGGKCIKESVSGNVTGRLKYEGSKCEQLKTHD